MYESYYCVMRHALEIASQCVHEHVIYMYMHDIVILLLINIIQYCVASLDVYMHMYCL